MQFIKLTERHAVPLEQIQYIATADLAMVAFDDYKTKVTVLRPDGSTNEYYSVKTVSELVDEINKRS